MTKKKPPKEPEETLEQTYLRILSLAYKNDAYWLKYLDGMDWQIVHGLSDETPEQTRDRRNKAAIMGAYVDVLKTRSEQEALAFVMEAIDTVKTAERHELWTKEQVFRIKQARAERGEEEDSFNDDVPI
jgi:hypothetical protein